ncbi:MAG: virulence RhuM family protein [Christensenellales bacterium]
MTNELQFVLYNIDKEDVKVKVAVQDETLWATQRGMAELFEVSVPTINEHIKNIYESEELDKESTIRNFRIVQTEGTRQVARDIDFYNLDVVISVGYRVNSRRATQFRIWATKVLKEFIKKGFVLDDERLKQGETVFGKDYFRELLERVRSIRASERRIWQQITDIFAECSVDYDKNSPITQEFYATVQNKFHYAITGQTAAEIIYEKADSTKDNMGLTTWKNSPDGRILKSDVTIAKNYLDEKQIRKLERTVSGFFDYVEDLIEEEQAFTMQQFAESINAFLEFRKYKILQGNGTVSKRDADRKATQEYDLFNKTQRITSDFDKEVKKMLGEKKED